MKPKCPKCGGSRLAIRAAYDRTVQTEVHCGTVDGFVVFKGCGWSKRISDPAIIRFAVEPDAEYRRGYAAGYEAVMRDRIRDAMEAKRNG